MISKSNLPKKEKYMLYLYLELVEEIGKIILLETMSDAGKIRRISVLYSNLSKKLNHIKENYEKSI